MEIDVESQALVALTLLAIGLIFSYPPARRATRVARWWRCGISEVAGAM
jgi:hypothetical protein